MKHRFVYILTSPSGMTNHLQRRVHWHKNKLIPGFTKRDDVNRLVTFETISESVPLSSRPLAQLRAYGSRRYTPRVLRIRGPQLSWR